MALGTYGITSTGFVKKTLAEIIVERQNRYKAAFGNSINLLAPSVFATIIGIESDREADQWDLAEENWNSRSSSSAQGVSLDNIGDLTAQERLKALPSTIATQLFFGDAGTTIPTSLIASVLGNLTAQFSPLVACVLVAGTTAVQHLAFSAVPTSGSWAIVMPDGQATGTLAYNAVASAVQIAIRLLSGWDGVTVTGDYTAGFTVTFLDGATLGSAALQAQAALSSTGALVASATPVVVTQSDTTVGVPQGSAKMVATVNGPTVAASGALSVIGTPVTGLRATKNFDAASVGRLLESDSDYRIRRFNELQGDGATTVEAIRVRLGKVSGVTKAIVYQNTEDTTDGNGVPPHSLHIYAVGGTNADIAEAIWLAAGGGIQTYGSVTVDVIDSEGFTQVINFDRPSNHNVYIIANITKDTDLFPSTGAADVLNAILAYGSSLQVGDDVKGRTGLVPYVSSLVAGIVDFTCDLGFSPSPSGTANLTIAASEIAAFDSSRITVNVS